MPRVCSSRRQKTGRPSRAILPSHPRRVPPRFTAGRLPSSRQSIRLNTCRSLAAFAVKPSIDPRELARRNNEATAVEHAFQELRRQRRQFRLKSPLPKKILDALARREAERIARPVRAVGFFLPTNP